MKVSAAYNWPDDSSAGIEMDDCLDSFDPLRLKDMCVELRETFRLVISDAIPEHAEHEASDE